MSRARQFADLAGSADAGGLTGRNLVMNGAMTVAQRATSKTGVTTTGYYATDRMRLGLGSCGTWTISRDTNAPNGFSNSHKLLCTTAAPASLSASAHLLGINFKFEGQDLQPLAYGTADAKDTTLSFWVKSNKTGTASVSALQSDNSNRMWSNTYTINTADTWEYKTIYIPADTSGFIANDNGQGLEIDFWLNGGSTYTGGSTQTTWTSFNQTHRNPSNLGLGNTVNDYWQITGVQLEVGDKATSFEHRSYSEELQLCKRYYRDFISASGVGSAVSHMGCKYSGNNGTWLTVLLDPEMRTSPTVVSNTWQNSSPTTYNANSKDITLHNNTASFYANTNTNFTADAEL